MIEIDRIFSLKIHTANITTVPSPFLEQKRAPRCQLLLKTRC